MKGMRALPLVWGVLTASTPPVEAARVTANPLAKVLELMDSLTAKLNKESEAEAKAYKDYTSWCDDASANKNFEIKTATTKQAKLEAAIGKSSADAEAAGVKIEELAASLSSGDADLKAATAMRTKEAADFASNEAELLGVVDTLGRAITLIGREMAKNPAAFAQADSPSLHGLLGSLSAVVDAAALPGADKQQLMALVQERQGTEADSEELGAPASAVYKSHSSNIVDVLADMKEKAEEQLSSLRKAETTAKHNFAMLKQGLEDQATSDTKDLAEQKAGKAAAEEAKATAEGDLTTTVKELADAKSTLEMANTDCMQTAADHEATVKARAAELKTIAEAKQILVDSTTGAVGQSYSMMQVNARAASHLQSRADLANAAVVNLVKRLAKRHHSSALAQLASRISAVMKYGTGGGADPFLKVKGLISDLIAKLNAEAGSEATEKAYCDEQLAKTEEKKGELESDISKLTTKIDQAAAKSAALKGEVKELQDELATLARQQAEMDKSRQEGHAAYLQAKADLEAGLAGVQKALGVLREYYGSGASAALVQSAGGLSAAMRQPTMPARHSKATGAGGGIVGILEVVESDFARGLAAEETEEDTAQAEFDKLTQANKVTKTLKDQDVKYKTQEFQGLDKSVADLTADKDTSDAELNAVLEYYAKIKERCIAKPETYAARKARREAEIEGLKEALTILEDEVAFVQRSKRGLRGGGFIGLAEH